MSSRSALEHRLLRRVVQTCHTYQLIEPNDRLMVCLSGGKDSYTMLSLLRLLQRQSATKFDIVAVHLDQQQPGYDGTPLLQYLKSTGVAFEILSENTYGDVKVAMEQGQTPCVRCSRLRRGILYTAAQRLGVTKIALGHHREDTLETFLLNLVYTGKLQAMPARYQTDDGRFAVIRPLIECAEHDIAAYAQEQQFPILPCTLCGSQPNLKRNAMGQLLEQLAALNPQVKQSMLGALQNVRATHLLDPEVAEAWAERPQGIAARSAAKETSVRFLALPVHSNIDVLLAPP
jgi:tRNA 2-thiocytidine biosynthesis protein TtcA